jgi:hypothetical protein
VVGDEARYVISVERARESVATLLTRETHPFFIAYLHLRRVAGQRRTLVGLNPHWPDLGSVLEVPGGPPGKPYLRPFWKGSRQSGQEWLNKNLAGSFAPSSLRGTPLEIIEITASGSFNLKERHWQQARQHLLLGQPMPVLPLAAFLFRDRALVSTDVPDPAALVTVFREHYGYTPDADEEFDYLYDLAGLASGGDWFEPLGPPAAPEVS